MTRSRSPIRLAIAVVAIALTLAIAACSKSDSSSSSSSTSTTSATQAYCSSWQTVVDSFNSLGKIDILGNGLNALTAPVDNLQSGLQGLATATDSLIKPKVQALQTAVKGLADTITSTSLPIDRTQQVKEAKIKVDDAWNDLVATIRTSCPGVSASKV